MKGPVAVELCHYHLHAPLLLLVWPGRCVKGEILERSKIQSKEAWLTAQHGELAESHTGWPREQAAFPVIFPHTQPKTGSHLTGPWDSGPALPIANQQDLFAG